MIAFQSHRLTLVLLPRLLPLQLVIVVCAILFSAETDANGLRQLLFGMLVLLVALLTHMYAYPFDRRNLNNLESATIAAQFFSLFVGLAFLSNKMSKGFSKFMEITNLIVMAISFFACGYFIMLDLFPDFRSKYAEFWEKRREAKLRKIRDAEREKAGDDMSIVGYKKVMEFRWRTTLGATASKLLTATGARILCEFIDSEQSLDEIINEGRPRRQEDPCPDRRHRAPSHEEGGCPQVLRGPQQTLCMTRTTSTGSRRGSTSTSTSAPMCATSFSRAFPGRTRRRPTGSRRSCRWSSRARTTTTTRRASSASWAAASPPWGKSTP